MKLFANIAVVVVAGSGCTALVLIDDAQLPPCEEDVDCPAGSVCDDGICDDVSTASVPGEAVLIGAAGGVVAGPDGVTFVIPPDAVVDALPFVIGRASETLLFDNFEPRSRFYAISPAADLAVPGLLEVPADQECAAVGSCQLFLRPLDGGETWEAIARENAKLDRTGIFAVGVVVGGAP
ncbi:MAG: hypothetical protein Q8O67_28375 [Deltaproteobacteria bacterium]|nr:hypothetical protein [Deltaproteobacteria bacterium]